MNDRRTVLSLYGTVTHMRKHQKVWEDPCTFPGEKVEKRKDKRKLRKVEMKNYERAQEFWGAVKKGLRIFSSLTQQVQFSGLSRYTAYSKISSNNMQCLFQYCFIPDRGSWKFSRCFWGILLEIFLSNHWWEVNFNDFRIPFEKVVYIPSHSSVALEH